ncbi:flagellar filament capping protein FliD [Magnetococcales bacterium HHB-1]
MQQFKSIGGVLNALIGATESRNEGGYTGLPESFVKQLRQMRRSYGPAAQQHNPFVIQRDAFMRLESRLLTLKHKAANSRALKNFTGRAGSSFNSRAVNVTTSGIAPPATYTIQIDQLATFAAMALGKNNDPNFNNPGQPIRTHVELTSGRTFTFIYNGKRYDVDLNPGDNLHDIVNKVNTLDFGDQAGVRAGILYEQDNFYARLLLTAQDSGAFERNDRGKTIESRLHSIRILDPVTQLRAPLSFGGAPLVDRDFFHTDPGQAAKLIIDDNPPLFSDANIVNNIIPHVTLELKQSTDTPFTIKIAHNPDQIRRRLMEFLEIFNNVIALIQTERHSHFGDDPLLDEILLAMYRAVEEKNSENSHTLFDLGVFAATDEHHQGQLFIDPEKFKQIVDQNPPVVAEVMVGNPKQGVSGLVQRIESLMSKLTAPYAKLAYKTSGLKQRIAQFEQKMQKEERRFNRVHRAYASQFKRTDRLRGSLDNSNALLSGMLHQLSD